MTWDSMLLLVEDYVSAHGGLPPSTAVWRGHRIGEWLNHQYRQYSHGSLDAASAEKLRRVPHLFPGVHSMLPSTGRPFDRPTPRGIYQHSVAARQKADIIPAKSISGFQVVTEVLDVKDPSKAKPEPPVIAQDDRRKSHPPGNVESPKDSTPPVDPEEALTQLVRDAEEDGLYDTDPEVLRNAAKIARKARAEEALTTVPEPAAEEPAPSTQTEETTDNTKETPDMADNQSAPEKPVKSPVKAVPAVKVSSKKRRELGEALDAFVAALGTLTPLSNTRTQQHVRVRFQVTVPDWEAATPLIGVWGVKLASTTPSGLVFQASVWLRAEEFLPLVQALGSHGHVSEFQSGGETYVPQSTDA